MSILFTSIMAFSETRGPFGHRVQEPGKFPLVLGMIVKHRMNQRFVFIVYDRLRNRTEHSLALALVYNCSE